MKSTLAKRREFAIKEALPALSYAEMRVLPHLLMGKSAKQIGEALGLSPFTISNHTRKIFGAFKTTQRSVVIATFLDLPIAELDEALFENDSEDD